MRVVTRPDLDGVVYAALLCAVEQMIAPIEWVSPNEMQAGSQVRIPVWIFGNSNRLCPWRFSLDVWSPF